VCLFSQNNCHGVMGNSAQGIGYGCQMEELVRSWRNDWSAVPGTTDPREFAPQTSARNTNSANYTISTYLYLFVPCSPPPLVLPPF
jgi:hypothetical protein